MFFQDNPIKKAHLPSGIRGAASRCCRQLLFTVLILTGLVSPVLAQTGSGKTNPWTHSLHFENDLFNGTDSNYTNGVKYSLISPDLSLHATTAHLPQKALEWVHRLPFIQDSGSEYSHKAEFALGQNIYTPADTSRSDLISEDRPYAGWTYLGLAYHRRAKLEQGQEFLDSVEIQLGVVGPLSLAEETQILVHDLRDLETAKGWDHQLKNEPGLLIAFERKRLFYPENAGLLLADAIIHLGGAIGNVSTYLNGGLELRYGLNLPKNFGVSVIRPAGSTRFSPTKEFSIYLFGAINGKYVLHDIFLDGNTFTDSHSIDKKDFVADLAAGVTVSHGNLMLTYTNVTRTREFVGQKHNHNFGSLTLTFFYPFW